MRNKDRIINVPTNEEECPADALMSDFRRKVKKAPKKSYSKNVSISGTSVKFWQDHADIVNENEDYITFYWDEIKEEDLPPLKIKVRKGKDKCTLLYLKEYGKEEKLLIKGKPRKGKNKGGKIFLDKEDGEVR